VRSQIDQVVCPSCGCLCDDLTVDVQDGRVVQVRQACGDGRALFMTYDPAPRPPTVEGRAASWEAAIAEAARILVQADSPLIYGLSSTSSEAQRQAVALADWLGAVVDSTSSVCHGPTALAMQATGEPTCTLGAVRDRADLVIFWGCNPAESHPRHLARYSLTARGGRTPRARANRTAVVVDVRPTSTTRTADLFLQVTPGGDYEALSVLRALVAGRRIRCKQAGGVPLAHWRDLAERMKACRFGVAFVGVGLTMSPGRDLSVSELLTLVVELNQHTRFAAVPMRGHGNVAGADQVLGWQTGYPFAVSFARGFPRYGPGEFSATDLLARDEVDAALIVASDPTAHLPAAAVRRLAGIPTIVLDPNPSLTTEGARVVLPTACCGLDGGGTFYRMDGVAIRLRPVLPAQRPSDAKVLGQILTAARQC